MYTQFHLRMKAKQLDTYSQQAERNMTTFSMHDKMKFKQAERQYESVPTTNGNAVYTKNGTRIFKNRTEAFTIVGIANIVKKMSSYRESKSIAQIIASVKFSRKKFAKFSVVQ